MNTWESPVLNYNGPPLPAKVAGVTPPPTALAGWWDVITNSVTATFSYPGMSPEQSQAQKEAPHKASTAAGKALGIDPASWQTFIRQTLTDWGVYAGLGVLLALGLVFLVSATGGGSPQVVIQKVGKKVSSGA